MENLVKVSTYAKQIDKSVTWVYRLATNKVIKIQFKQNKSSIL